MFFVGIEKRLESEEAILTADGGSATKLKSWLVMFEKAEGMAVHDGGENIAAHVHQHDASPLVPVRQIA